MTTSTHTPGEWTPKYIHGVGWTISAPSHLDAVVPGITTRVADAIGNQADAHLIASAPELLRAAQLLEAAEDFNANDCRECEGDGAPEACPKCFPLFDDARIARRNAISLATGAS